MIFIAQCHDICKEGPSGRDSDVLLMQVQQSNPDGGLGDLKWHLLAYEPKGVPGGGAQRPRGPFVGTWVDASRSWYDGSIVEFTAENTWKPLNPKQSVQRSAQYAANIISESEWDLFEVRSNGDERRFKVTCDKDSSGLQVQLMRPDGSLSDLKWQLVTCERGAENLVQGSLEEVVLLQNLVPNHEQPLVGTWVDELRSLYDGSIIEFTAEKTWKLLNPKQQVHQTAFFACTVNSKREWILSEVRADGDERRFVVTYDPAISRRGLQVQLMRVDGTLSDLAWHLVACRPGRR